jgi:uncharacterized protein with FMN-binding domain
MKRVLLSITATVFGVVALLSFKTHGHPLATAAGGLPSAAAPGGSAAGSQPPSSTTTTSAPPKPGARSSAPASTKQRYVGSAVETQYGIVQVAVVVSGRHIDSVNFVQLTAFDGRSQEINSQAAPILLQETVSAQSGHIDTVSGATYTSEGYLQSLQSALDRAGIR